jgi:hypothetical protein
MECPKKVGQEGSAGNGAHLPAGAGAVPADRPHAAADGEPAPRAGLDDRGPRAPAHVHVRAAPARRPAGRHHREPGERGALPPRHLRQLPQGPPGRVHDARLPGAGHLQRRRRGLARAAEGGQLRVQHALAPRLRGALRARRAARPPPPAAAPRRGVGRRPRPPGRAGAVRVRQHLPRRLRPRLAPAPGRRRWRHGRRRQLRRRVPRRCESQRGPVPLRHPGVLEDQEGAERGVRAPAARVRRHGARLRRPHNPVAPGGDAEGRLREARPPVAVHGEPGRDLLRGQGPPPRRRDQLPPRGAGDHVLGPHLVLLAALLAAGRAAPHPRRDRRGARPPFAGRPPWHRGVRPGRAAGDALRARGDHGVDAAVPSGACELAARAGGRRPARRHGRAGRVVRGVQPVRDGADGVGLGRGRAGVQARAVAEPRRRDVPAREPVPVRGVPRGAEAVPGQGDGLHPDEVHRGGRAGGARRGRRRRVPPPAGTVADAADGGRAPRDREAETGLTSCCYDFQSLCARLSLQENSSQAEQEQEEAKGKFHLLPLFIYSWISCSLLGTSK